MICPTCSRSRMASLQPFTPAAILYFDDFAASRLAVRIAILHQDWGSQAVRVKQKMAAKMRLGAASEGAQEYHAQHIFEHQAFHRGLPKCATYQKAASTRFDMPILS